MKTLTYLLLLFILVFSQYSCKENKSKNTPPEVKEEYFNDDIVKLKSPLKEKIGSWAKIGSECYGIVVFTNKDGVHISGSTIKCKIVSMQPNKVKCKALEKVAMKKDSKSCKKSAINVGQTWWEEEGELWQTKEEAQKHLSKLGI